MFFSKIGYLICPKTLPLQAAKKEHLSTTSKSDFVHPNRWAVTAVVGDLTTYQNGQLSSFWLLLLGIIVGFVAYFVWQKKALIKVNFTEGNS